MPSLRAAEIAGLGFEQMVRSAPVSIVVVDASGRVVHSNERARALTGALGYEMPDGLHHAIDIFHPDGRRYERDEWPAVRSLTTGEDIVDEEFFYVVPESAPMWVRCSSSAVRDKDATIVAAILTQTDVSERKREEARLTHLAGLLDNTEDAIVALDSEWFITGWNAGAERMYGWTAEEVMGRHTLDVARLEMSHAQRSELRVRVAERGRWRGEMIAYRNDGAPLRVELITVALRDANGDVTGFLGIHRDVSERHRVMEELRESQQRVETILESITDAFVAVDADWRYTYVNDRALARMRDRKGTALAREDVIGRDMREMFPEGLGSEIHRQFELAMRERRAVAFESYFAYSGEWIEAHAYPSGSGLAIYYRDVSARRQGEQALRRAEDQRDTAARGLDEVREAERTRLARDLHDGALQGLTHALAITGRHGPGRDDEVREVLEQVGRQVRAAIYDVRLEQEAERPFSDALREIVAINRAAVTGCDVTLETGDDLPAGSFGRRGTEVLRIIGEALTNACRHAGAQRIVVRVTGSDTRLSVEVTDDGRGLDRTGKPSAPYGQGLRGMRERAELLGSRLDIRSDETGTTVSLDVALRLS